MKLSFKAIRVSPPAHTISGDTINGVDFSLFPEGAFFVGNDEMFSQGILNVEREAGELHITLGQPYTSYECQPVNGSHDWRGTGVIIDSADYDPGRCYIVAPSAPEGAEYVKRENGWTVVMPSAEEEFAE